MKIYATYLNRLNLINFTISLIVLNIIQMRDFKSRSLLVKVFKNDSKILTKLSMQNNTI